MARRRGNEYFTLLPIKVLFWVHIRRKRRRDKEMLLAEIPQELIQFYNSVRDGLREMYPEVLVSQLKIQARPTNLGECFSFSWFLGGKGFQYNDLMSIDWERFDVNEERRKVLRAFERWIRKNTIEINREYSC
jgi:hypothetical protein